MTGSDLLLRLAGSRAEAGPPAGLGLADLCREQLPSLMSLPLQAIEDKDDPDIDAELAIVRHLAAGLAQAAPSVPDTVDALYDLVAAIVADIVGDAIDADSLGLRARVERELRALGAAVADVRLFVSAADAGMLEPSWPELPLLIADAELARGSFRIESGLKVWEDSVAWRLGACLAQLRSR